MVGIDITKRYVVQDYDDATIIIEFTQDQDIRENEEYVGMIAYECYILDDDNEAAIRAIYYYDQGKDFHCLKYRDDPTDNNCTTMYICRLSPIQAGQTTDEALDKAEEEEAAEPGYGLCMGDIC